MPLKDIEKENLPLPETGQNKVDMTSQENKTVNLSLRKKNPEAKWKWDLANVIAWILLMPCSIAGYMIFCGVF